MWVYSMWNGQAEEVEGGCPPGFTELAPPAGMSAPMFREGYWVSAMPWSPPPMQPTTEEIQAQAAAYLNSLRMAAMDTNNRAYAAAIDHLTSDYPAAEISTWERQRAEAVAWGADPESPTPWIDTAAMVRGLDRDIYLERTLAKVNAFASATAYLTGRRQGIDDRLRAATTVEQLAAITIDYTLPGA